jgi:16S rRNA (adenine1518-N6/adenine1519-N6)-dimethyltransferase
MYTLKKSLGQHFLHDRAVCEKIITALQERPFQRLLEVGPGGGALTGYLLQIKDIDFKAVEIDREKIEYLVKAFPNIKEKLINESVLDIQQPFELPFTIVGNFPYNISTQIVFKILDWKDNVECMVGMFQKEVAERIAAPEGSKVYGILSVLVKAFFEVEYLFEVNEQAFTPPPKVKSAVIRFTPRADKPAIKSERAFFNLVKTAFNQRRKMLRNGVKGLFKPEILEDGIFSKRAEQLSVEDFASLTFKMN